MVSHFIHGLSHLTMHLFIAGSQYTFYKAGDYQFNCSVFGMEIDGEFSVVSATHTVSLCEDCGWTGEAVMTVNAGEVVQWTTDDRVCAAAAVMDVNTGEVLDGGFCVCVCTLLLVDLPPWLPWG